MPGWIGAVLLTAGLALPPSDRRGAASALIDPTSAVRRRQGEAWRITQPGVVVMQARAYRDRIWAWYGRSWLTFVAVNTYFVVFGVGGLFVFLGRIAKDPNLERLGVGLVFGIHLLGLGMIIAAFLVRQARSRLSAGGPRLSSFVGVAGLMVVLLGAMTFMGAGVLAAIGFNGATLVTGPNSPLEPFIQAGFGVLAVGVVMIAMSPPTNLPAAARTAGWGAWLFTLLIRTWVGRAAIALVGVYLGWFVLFGRSTLLDVAVVVAVPLALAYGVVSWVRRVYREQSTDIVGESIDSPTNRGMPSGHDQQTEALRAAQGALRVAQQALPAGWLIGNPAYDKRAGHWSATALAGSRAELPGTMTETGPDLSAVLLLLAARLAALPRPKVSLLRRVARGLVFLVSAIGLGLVLGAVEGWASAPPRASTTAAAFGLWFLLDLAAPLVAAVLIPVALLNLAGSALLRVRRWPWSWAALLYCPAFLISWYLGYALVWDATRGPV